MDKEDLIMQLTDDYAGYLSDLNIEELNLIAESGMFTLRQAREDNKSEVTK